MTSLCGSALSPPLPWWERVGVRGNEECRITPAANPTYISDPQIQGEGASAVCCSVRASMRVSLRVTRSLSLRSLRDIFNEVLEAPVLGVEALVNGVETLIDVLVLVVEALVTASKR